MYLVNKGCLQENMRLLRTKKPNPNLVSYLSLYVRLEII